MEKRSFDRELYPALLITLGVGLTLFLFWWYFFDAPAFLPCWFFTKWHIYCPACGGTRAMIALIHGHIFESLYWNPAVLIGAVSVAAYVISQSVWRLRNKRGWVQQYDNRWLYGFLLVFTINCLIRNILWFQYGISL